MFTELPPIPQRDDSREISPQDLDALASYVRGVIIEYGSGAHELGLELDPEGVLHVLSALERQVAGQEWEMPQDDCVRSFFLHGLYFELSERRQSLKEMVNGRENPISDGVWLAVLTEIRKGMNDA